MVERVADRVTLRNIAAIAGVAPSTVYRALTGKEGVGAETRERIVQLAQQMGIRLQPLRPGGGGTKPAAGLTDSPWLQSGLAQPTLAITLIIDSRNNPFLRDLADNPFYLELIAGISEASQALGYRLSVEIAASEADLVSLFQHIVPEIDWKRTTTDEIVLPDRRRTLSRVFGRGIVWLGYQPYDAYMPWIPVLARLGVPTVLCDHYVNNLPCDAVVSDNIGGARELGAHVAGLGHRRVCILRQALTSAASWERTLGFQAALYEAGLRLDDVQLIAANPTFEGGYDALPEALESGATAILCGNDMMAMGVLRRAAELGVKVPESLSVCGFDDIATSGRLTPALTTARVDQRAIGREALRRLWTLSQLALAAGAEATEPAKDAVREVPGDGVAVASGQHGDGEVLRGIRIVVPTRLVVRETTGPAPDKLVAVATSARATEREE
ncbi:MAG: LacI family DNA-binding transcriptional regulator [Limnochordaceae bacterium]|nr:LacI family DNA-binding transcriptional regulator [Limnochordaceae bacterium]